MSMLVMTLPDRTFWKDTVQEVILPTLGGQMGVLKNHVRMLTGLDTGLIYVRRNSSSDWFTLVVTGGFALINDNTVTILVNEAELVSEINLEEAEGLYLSSKHNLNTNRDIRKKFELISQFKKARARYEARKALKTLI
uniref:ATP synthase epsilon chain, chloroplastic n=1 Tax=Euglena hiemalis TaxID=392896 RepID=A0A345UC26_9EUGL|nr:ATPase epsilon subunit [Euglena hiemalis]AXI98012.1 ATPase epsilon subunit [Euglena hiemalis]